MFVNKALITMSPPFPFKTLFDFPGRALVYFFYDSAIELVELNRFKHTLQQRT